MTGPAGLLCCAWRPRRSDKPKDKLDAGSGSEDVSILADEGANAQYDLWQLAQLEKAETLVWKEDTSHHAIPIGTEFTLEASLELVKAEYAKNGLAQKIPTISRVLNSLQPFTQAITAMSQSSAVVSLVWGSVQILLQSIMRFTTLFDDITDMLTKLSADLPRFQATTEVLLTPRLHNALRVVYQNYVDFCTALTAFLRSRKYEIIIKADWSSVVQRFQKATADLNAARSEFDAEVRLADIQEQKKRHEDLVSRIEANSSSKYGLGRTVSTVLLSRNTMFSGRDDVLSQLHTIIEPSLKFEKDSERSRRSCTVHAIGGMGKTEVVLEYTYRYQSSFSHIFWLHCETEAVLLQSFMAVLRRLGIYDETVDPDVRIEKGLYWFQAAETPWLVVFDNAEDVRIIRRYWPPGIQGAIIVTSQNPGMADICTDSIHLQPMPPEEGSALIQKYLRRGRSEQEAAQELSNDLGGIPLAIAHFSGYIARSECMISDINKVLQGRFKSRTIWTVDCTSTLSLTGYTHTLGTVWELAWSRLGNDARRLLYLLSFFNPDSVPEDMFLRTGDELTFGTWEFWDHDRLNETIRQLRERHLVERDENIDGGSLRTHRALQKHLLYKLDNEIEERASVFSNVVSILRHAFPEPSVAKRGDSSLFAISQKYIRQVISANAAYQQAATEITGDFMFAELLRDSGYYLMNSGDQPDAIPILQTAEKVCKALIKDGHDKVRTTMADAIGTLQLYYNFMGIKGRKDAKELCIVSINSRIEQMADIPESQWTQLDHINYARSYFDMSEATANLHEMDDARRFVDMAIAHYEKAGGPAEVPARIGNAECYRVMLNATKDDEKALETAQTYFDLVISAVGLENFLTFYTRHIVALTAFKIGKIKEAKQLHEENFKMRSKLKGKSNNDTLASEYNLAVCHHVLGDWEDSESCLRHILENSTVGVHWRNEDVSRVKFRLSLVLGSQRRRMEAEKFRKEALDLRKQWEDQLPGADSAKNDQDEMVLFDFGASLSNGRTAGIWSDGEQW